jgi:hypothetical protein
MWNETFVANSNAKVESWTGKSEKNHDNTASIGDALVDTL